MTLKFELGLDF